MAYADLVEQENLRQYTQYDDGAEGTRTFISVEGGRANWEAHLPLIGLTDFPGDAAMAVRTTDVEITWAPDYSKYIVHYSSRPEAGGGGLGAAPEDQWDMSAVSRKTFLAVGEPALFPGSGPRPLPEPVSVYGPHLVRSYTRLDAPLNIPLIYNTSGRTNRDEFYHQNDQGRWLFLGAIARPKVGIAYRTTYRFAYDDLEWKQVFDVGGAGIAVANSGNGVVMQLKRAAVSHWLDEASGRMFFRPSGLDAGGNSFGASVGWDDWRWTDGVGANSVDFVFQLVNWINTFGNDYGFQARMYCGAGIRAERLVRTRTMDCLTSEVDIPQDGTYQDSYDVYQRVNFDLLAIPNDGSF